MVWDRVLPFTRWKYTMWDRDEDADAVAERDIALLLRD
jgi:hypothetical protein